MGCTGNSGYLYRCSAQAESFLFKDKVRLPAEVFGTAKTAISVRLINLAGKGNEVKGFYVPPLLLALIGIPHLFSFLRLESARPLFNLFSECAVFRENSWITLLCRVYQNVRQARSERCRDGMRSGVTVRADHCPRSCLNGHQLVASHFIEQASREKCANESRCGSGRPLTP
jgi:hypothetical protein